MDMVNTGINLENLNMMDFGHLEDLIKIKN